jgi:hypothetical protein
MSYGLLEGDGYKHGTVRHRAKEYACCDYWHDAVHHVNGVENFWRLSEASVRSTRIHVSAKYMDRYLTEFSFRSSHRERKNAMFDLLIGSVYPDMRAHLVAVSTPTRGNVNHIRR